jgi:hypothetical protein
LSKEEKENYLEIINANADPAKDKFKIEIDNLVQSIEADLKNYLK